MKPFKPTPRGLLAAAIFAVALLCAPSIASACSCFPPSVTSSYQNSDEVFAGSVFFKATVGMTTWHLARVKGSFKGCLEKKDWVIVKTASSGAACGAYLETGQTYLLFGSDVASSWSVPVVHINSCSANRKVSAVTADERQWLLGRTRCCDNQCSCVGGMPMVSCFVDPCMFAVCPSGSCQSNYCGGCNAEFYTDAGYEVCTSCSDDDDCAWNLHCAIQSGGGGLCLEACYSDADCNEGHWCANINTEGDKACKAYKQEGESCGGYTPIWAVTKCAPGLSCTDVPPKIPDLPGKCRKPCQADGDCGKDQYCSSGNYCRDHGACFANADCEMAANNYLQDDCEGYGLCDGGSCTWQCGSGLCADLAGVNFGLCEMVLGWGVVGGKCAMISGCDAQGYTFFDSQSECQEACPGLF